MYIAIIILVVIIAVLLVLVILIQDPKSGGISSQFGGADKQMLGGAKKSTELIEKVTWSFAGVILVLSLLTNVFIDRNSANGTNSVNQERASEKRTLTPTPTPTPDNAEQIPLGGDSTK